MDIVANDKNREAYLTRFGSHQEMLMSRSAEKHFV